MLCAERPGCIGALNCETDRVTAESLARCLLLTSGAPQKELESSSCNAYVCAHSQDTKSNISF
jgi:hypothetical protein